MMLVALILSVFCATTAFGQKTYKAELDDSMFKAWTSNEPGAQVDPEPATEPKADNPFKCENNFYKEVGAYGCVWGSSSVYYLWYADLTGTKTITVKGTPGMSIRMMLNREPYVEGGAGDADGGAYVERIQSIGEDGTVVFDVSDLTYVHLNAIKVPGGGTAGVVTEIILNGTVKPVTGILSMISNGDAEGEDIANLSFNYTIDGQPQTITYTTNFPVSYDGPNNGGIAPEKPEIVDGGVGGSKCFKVTSFPEPTETWHTQFFVLSDEPMEKGTKWCLKMAIKADHDSKISTSAQGAPRAWKGSMGIDDFYVTSEWQEFTWSGEIGVDGFQSIAIDLNNTDDGAGNGDCNFYFDNIEFGVDLGGSNPMSMVSATYGADVIEVNLQGATNIAEMVKAGDGKKVFFPNDCVSVTWNGKPANPLSVEGRPNGNLYIFLNDIDGDESIDNFLVDDAEVKIAFTNPADQQIQFTTGKWEGQPVPDFNGMVCAYNEELGSGEFESSLWAAATLVSADPEDGSFNLDPSLAEFTLTFDQKIDLATVEATLDKEALTASLDETGKVVILKRTATGSLAGVHTLYVDRADTERGKALELPFTLKWSFGPTTIDPDDQPETLYQSNFTGDGDDANGAGWQTTADNQAGLQPASSSAGNRLQHGQAGYAADVLYLAQRSAAAGIALYGLDEEHKLTLAGGKTYHLTLKSAQWDAYPASGSNRSLRAQILTEDAVSTEDGSIIDESGILGEQFQVVDGRVKEDKEFTAFDIAFTPEKDGNFVIRLVAGDLNGNPAGYNDGNAIADVKIEYIPNVMGIVEINALAAALETAKDTYDTNNDERYAGAALTTLDNLIKEYEDKSMTAPSAYNKAVADLNAAVKAVNEHVKLCQDYDALPDKAFTLYVNNKGTKFDVTEVFKSLEAVVKKYCVLGTETQVDEETNEEKTVEVMESFKMFYDDAELTAAKDELTSVVGVAEYYFTAVGLDAGIQQGNCGVAVLVERNRLGARTLMALGVDESDPLIEAVNNSITDDDDLAAQLKARITMELYSQLKDANNTLFEAEEDENGDMIAKSYDMTVFIKNPNIYAVDGTKDTSEENVPGWTFPAQYGKPGLFKKWDPQRNVAGLPEDCAFTTWWGTCRMEQTVTDLPAGIYTVSLCGSDWSNRAGQTENPYDVAGFVYCKTSDTTAPEEGEDEDRDLHFAATRTIVYGGQYNMDHAHNLGYAEVMNDETGFISTEDGEFFGIPVTDGNLTLGIHFAGDGQYFFQHARLTLMAPATFDYAGAYQELVNGVETAKTATVRALEVYDLNGRRLVNAKKGINIVKKVMSDGTVKTQKIVK